MHQRSILLKGDAFAINGDGYTLKRSLCTLKREEMYSRETNTYVSEICVFYSSEICVFRSSEIFV